LAGGGIRRQEASEEVYGEIETISGRLDMEISIEKEPLYEPESNGS